MELAIRELGRIRILFAAAIAAITKPFGIKGAFYVICGPKAQAIDGPCSYTIPPYNNYAKMAPKDPDKVAKKLQEITKAKAAVVIDANDIGVNVLGKSDKKLNNKILAAIFFSCLLDKRRVTRFCTGASGTHDSSNLSSVCNFVVGIFCGNLLSE